MLVEAQVGVEGKVGGHLPQLHLSLFIIVTPYLSSLYSDRTQNILGPLAESKVGKSFRVVHHLSKVFVLVALSLDDSLASVFY